MGAYDFYHIAINLTALSVAKLHITYIVNYRSIGLPAALANRVLKNDMYVPTNRYPVPFPVFRGLNKLISIMSQVRVGTVYVPILSRVYVHVAQGD